MEDLDADGRPDGDIYLHVDIDVADPAEVPDLLYPAPGGPSVAAVLAAVQRVAATGRVVAVGVAATWRHGGESAAAHDELLRRLVAAVQPPAGRVR